MAAAIAQVRRDPLRAAGVGLHWKSGSREVMCAGIRAACIYGFKYGEQLGTFYPAACPRAPPLLP